jgi:hypothetical protein
MDQFNSPDGGQYPMFADIVTIDITAEDIAQGEKNNCKLCPGALAAKRRFPGYNVIVTRSTVYIDTEHNSEDYFWVYDGGDALRNFTSAFDFEHDVEPCSFTLTRNDTRSVIRR